MPANLSFVESQARDAVLAHYGLSKIANSPRFEDAVKLVSPLRRAGAGFLSGALPGAAVGGIAGALSADNPEDRMRRALIGAAAGTAVGGGLNAARHYVGQRDIHSKARDYYDQIMAGQHNVIAGLEHQLKNPDISPANRHFFSENLDFAKEQLSHTADSVKKVFGTPQPTYLERLF